MHRNMKKEIYYQIHLMSQMMIDLNAPHLEIKLQEISKQIKRFRIIKINKHQNLFGNLLGSLNLKNKNSLQNNHQKKSQSYKMNLKQKINIWKKSINNFIKVNNLQNSQCFIYHFVEQV